MSSSIGKNLVISSEEWLRHFTPEMKRNYHACIDYYSYTSYNSDLVKHLKRNPEYIPTQQEYEKICLNLYMKRYLNSLYGSRIFDNGDLAKIKKNYKVSLIMSNWDKTNNHLNLSNKTIMVIDIFHPEKKENRCYIPSIFRELYVMLFENPDVRLVIQERFLAKVK